MQLHMPGASAPACLTRISVAATPLGIRKQSPQFRKSLYQRSANPSWQRPTPFARRSLSRPENGLRLLSSLFSSCVPSPPSHNHPSAHRAHIRDQGSLMMMFSFTLYRYCPFAPRFKPRRPPGGCWWGQRPCRTSRRRAWRSSCHASSLRGVSLRNRDVRRQSVVG